MNVGAVLQTNADLYGGKPALFCRRGPISFEDLTLNSLRLANSLSSLGIKKGDRVAIMLPNGADYAYCYLALFLLRAVAVPLDLGIKDELSGYLEHSGAKFLIAEKPKGSDYGALIRNVGSLERVIYRGAELDKLISEGATTAIEVEVDDDDPSAIFYTSGTTGRPKGVLWNYRHLASVGKICATRDLFTPLDVLISAIPFSHTAGLSYLLCCLSLASTVVVMERFNPAQFLQLIEEHRVSRFFAVPAILEAVLSLKHTESMSVPSVKWIAVFGAMSSPKLAGRLQKLFPNAVIFGGYGLTETAPPTTLPFLDKVKTGSVGQPPPWVEMRVLDENELPVPAGVVGEVAFKGWVVMVEYYRDPEMTAAVMKGGWFHTGDLGKLDEDGDLFLVGRKKEMIIVGGLNVYPEEVEAVILQHPAVSEAAVIGVSDELRGEKLKAVVVLKEGVEASREDIVSFCQKRLPPFKTPKLVEWAQSLPKLGSGKVARRSLK